jgi:hypothetical protein
VCTTELGYGPAQAGVRPALSEGHRLSIDPVDAHAKWSEDIRATQGRRRTS